MKVKLAPPQLPDDWKEELQSDGSLRVRASAQERAGSAYNGWALPLFAGGVLFSCCCGIALGPFWWLPLTAAVAAWIGHLVWLVGSDEFLEVTSGRLEIRPSLFGIPLPRRLWREAEIDVVGPIDSHWELRVVHSRRHGLLHRSASLGAVLGLASYLEDTTGWRVHYGTGLQSIFPLVLDIASSARRPAHWRLLFQQPVLYLGFADALKDERRRGGMLAALRALEAEQPRLLQAVDGDADTEVRIAALQLLTELGDRTVLRRARALLAHPSRELRLQAVVTLGRLRDVEAVPVLCGLLGAEAVLRPAVITALGEIGDARAVPALCAVLRASRSDHVSDIARLTAASLGQIGDPDALPALGLVLQQGPPAAREAAATAMGQIGHASALPPLRLALVEGEPTVRFRAAVALMNLRHPETVPALETALHDSLPNVRLAAVASLAAVGDAAAVQVLRRALENTEPLVRREAAVRLGLLAGQEGVSPIQLRAAVPALQRLSAPLSTERVEVKRACREALHRIEASTERIKRLPVPAAPGESLSEILPRPSETPVDPPGS